MDYKQATKKQIDIEALISRKMHERDSLKLKLGQFQYRINMNDLPGIEGNKTMRDFESQIKELENTINDLRKQHMECIKIRDEIYQQNRKVRGIKT